MISAEDFLRTHSAQIPSTGDSDSSISLDGSGIKSRRSLETSALKGGRITADRGVIDPNEAGGLADNPAHEYAGAPNQVSKSGPSSSTAGDEPVNSGQTQLGSKSTSVLGRVGLNNSPAPKPKPGSFRSFRSGSSTVLREGAEDQDACQEAALGLLDASARSSHALAQRLSRKGFAEGTISQVIDRLTRVGLLDDRAYAKDLLRSCLHRDLGERGVLKEMIRRGVDRSLAEEIINGAHEEGLFVDSAYELGRKIARRTKGLGPQVYKRRLWSAGIRKGHNPSLMAQVVGDLLDSDEPEE